MVPWGGPRINQGCQPQKNKGTVNVVGCNLNAKTAKQAKRFLQWRQRSIIDRQHSKPSQLKFHNIVCNIYILVSYFRWSRASARSTSSIEAPNGYLECMCILLLQRFGRQRRLAFAKRKDHKKEMTKQKTCHGTTPSAATFCCDCLATLNSHVRKAAKRDYFVSLRGGVFNFPISLYILES